MIRKILGEARGEFGAGPTPAQIFENSALTVVGKVDFSGDSRVVGARLEVFHSALMKNTTKGYGVLDAFSKGSLNAAVVCACIDALEEDDAPGSRRWRNAMRNVAVGGGEGNASSGSQRESRVTQHLNLHQALRLMIIAAAFDNKRSPMKSLIPLNFSAGGRSGALYIMTVFGSYVSSKSVRALDILRGVVAVKNPDALMMRQAIESVMWNLTALDGSEMAASADSIEDPVIRSILDRLYPLGGKDSSPERRVLAEKRRKLVKGVLHSLKKAGVEELDFFETSIRDAQRAFEFERAVAAKMQRVFLCEEVVLT